MNWAASHLAPRRVREGFYKMQGLEIFLNISVVDIQSYIGYISFK